MKNLLLHEIITANEVTGNSILYEVIQPYLNSLYTYYRDYFCSEPMLMVTSVTNATQYCKIIPSNEFYQAICEELGVNYINEEEEGRTDEETDIFADYETICFNSILLKDVIN